MHSRIGLARPVITAADGLWSVKRPSTGRYGVPRLVGPAATDNPRRSPTTQNRKPLSPRGLRFSLVVRPASSSSANILQTNAVSRWGYFGIQGELRFVCN